MKHLAFCLRVWLAITVSIAMTACGGGDEYEGIETVDGDTTPNRFLKLFNEQGGQIDQSSYAQAYYDAVDPMSRRTTAQDYISLHGLDTPDVHVIFRDSKDLGYGRDMYMRSYPNPSACGGQVIAFFVRNFSVQIVDGFAYGPVNLEAAIAEDLQHHVGSNAIEFGLGRADVGDPCSSEPIARFYTYQPNYASPGAAHPRRIRVDLDGRGEKAMPQPCITCHGGKLRPLDRFGRFVAMHANDRHDPAAGPPISDIGNTKARMQAFEVDTFEFSDLAGHRRTDYEDDLRRLNAAIFCTYPGSFGHPACDAHTAGGPGTGGVAAQADAGEWSGNFARDMLEGWYGGALETAGSVFDGSYVPAGWVPSVGGPPLGADALFTKVVGPNCFVCHGKRGSQLPSDGDLAVDGKDLDFSTWDKFISYADDIERLVYDEGRMPLGLLNYDNFWGDPEKPELLASFIAPHVTDSAGFQARRIDSRGDVIPPGRIVARAGPDRVTRPNAAITLNAGASLFANAYRWQLLSSPIGSTATIASPTGQSTDFSADTDGEYQLRLTASSSKSGSSRTDTVRVLVDSGLATAPRDLAFYNDIDTLMLGDCTSCHAGPNPPSPRPSGEPGVPVWWVPDAEQAAGATTGVPATVADPPALGFYEQVMARVNPDHIEDSLLLKKPSGQHHFGNLRPDFDASLAVGAPGRANYDLFLNWISEGAACGMVGPECP